MREVNDMLEFKACPRCRGDVHTNRDMYGTYRECLQCGYMVDVAQPSKLISVAVVRAKKKAA